MNIALYQPDIAQNVGSIMRLCACTGATLHIIEPCGFPFDNKRMRRSAMDYMEHVKFERHASWEQFLSYVRSGPGRILLLTTKASKAYTTIDYMKDDVVLLGRESAGVPDSVADAADEKLIVPMQPGVRSLNVAMTAAMVAGEIMRQIK